MQDLFGIEQKIFDNAAAYAAELKNGAPFEISRYEKIVEEYGRLLKQFRILTIISDKTTGSLNIIKHELQDKVYYDALTGIYNRRFLEENLQRMIRTYSRSNSFLSMLMIDIDFFKNYNDTYGHSKGDTCLKAVAEAIAGSLSRGNDYVARYGGEEFAVLLPDTDKNGARFVANKILNNIMALNIPHAKSETAGCITVSIGITTGIVEHTHKNEDYIKHADKALYQSKQNGRNRYTYIDFKEVI